MATTSQTTVKVRVDVRPFVAAVASMDADQAARIGAYFGHPVTADEWVGRYPAELVAHLKRQHDGGPR